MPRGPWLSCKRIQPFLRWAGSKRQLLPVLSRYWRKEYIRYVEPFAGSACLFFGLQPQQALLGDINKELIATYREVKERVDPVIDALREFKRGRGEYIQLRDADPAFMTGPRRAARFIYLNRFCFNGLYRTNRSGRFNVPYGGDKAGNIPNAEVLRGCSEMLKRAELIPGDFADTLENVREGDFVYMDPPFAVSSRRVFSEYDSAVFGWKEVQHLRACMDMLELLDIPFLVSYADCEESRFLRRGFCTERVTVRRNIAGFAAKRVLSDEILISNRRPRVME